MPTLTGAVEVRRAHRQTMGEARPWACTTSMPRSARATRALTPIPTLTRAIDPLETTGIEVPMRIVP